MLNRLFILAFSIIFLFAFRIWLNDNSFYEENNITKTLSQDENKSQITYTPPISISANPQHFDYVDNLKQWELKDNNRAFLYIFPAWPDTLSYTFDRVAVNYSSKPAANSTGKFKFSDY